MGRLSGQPRAWRLECSTAAGRIDWLFRDARRRIPAKHFMEITMVDEPYRNNWRNSKKYPDPKRTSRSQWAWEFLRRNPTYCAGYAAIRALLDDARFVSDRAQREIKTKKAGQLAFALCKQFGLAEPPGRAPDPASDTPPVLAVAAFRILDWIDGNPLERQGKISPHGPHEILVSLDLRLSLESQLEMLRIFYAGARQHAEASGLIKRVEVRLRAEHWPLYLRLLDAYVSGAPTKEIKAALYPDRSDDVCAAAITSAEMTATSTQERKEFIDPLIRARGDARASIRSRLNQDRRAAEYLRDEGYRFLYRAPALPQKRRK